MKKKDKLMWAKKLHPFWILRELAYDKFRKREQEIEKIMKKICKEDLEFIYMDMDLGCIGIGHAIFGERKRFPLFQREDLE